MEHPGRKERRMSDFRSSEISNDSDLISRKTAIELIEDRFMKLTPSHFGTGTFRDGLADGYARVISDLKTLPSAQPEIAEDGTLVVNVPDATLVKRVLAGDSRNFGGLYYPSYEKSVTGQPEWIEIYEEQENLPPLGVDVLLCVINGSMAVGYLMKDEEGLIWKVGTWYNDFLEWDAWRYLPEAWKGEMNE